MGSKEDLFEKMGVDSRMGMKKKKSQHYEVPRKYFLSIEIAKCKGPVVGIELVCFKSKRTCELDSLT